MRPSEVKAVALVLNQEHESAEDAAKAAIHALEGCRRDQRQLCIVRWEGFPVVIGGFSTENQVRKALEKGYGGSKYTVGYLKTPEGLEAAREATEAVAGAHDCPTCAHPRGAHWNRKWRAQGEKDWRKPGCPCGCEETF